MTKKVLASSVLLIALTMVAVYLFGMNHGRTGEGLTIIKEAVAAQEGKCLTLKVSDY